MHQHASGSNQVTATAYSSFLEKQNRSRVFLPCVPVTHAHMHGPNARNPRGSVTSGSMLLLVPSCRGQYRVVNNVKRTVDNTNACWRTALALASKLVSMRRCKLYWLLRLLHCSRTRLESPILLEWGSPAKRLEGPREHRHK